ncbi:MAG: TusE/DsrC/DsvC family sulfur relay protein [Pseudomonadota bacterium]
MQWLINEKIVELDKEGFLKKLIDWNEDVAIELAQQEKIQLTAAHWEIIELVRDFYQLYQLSPSMRALVKRAEQILGKEKGRSIYLLQLFPPSPAKLACKIAGLPKPSNCL